MNKWGYCVRKRKEKPDVEVEDNDNDIKATVFGWFETWSWQAYTILATVIVFTIALLILIIWLIVKIARQSTRNDKKRNR